MDRDSFIVEFSIFIINRLELGNSRLPSRCSGLWGDHSPGILLEALCLHIRIHIRGSAM